MTVPELSSDELMRLWESGVPLDTAWTEFADSFLLAVLHADPDKDPLLFGLHNRRYKELMKEGALPKTAEDRKKKLAIVTQDARSHLFREIYVGRRWAIGCRTLPNGANELVHVPRHHFLADHEKHAVDPRICWARGELEVGSDSYFAIRVVLAPRGTEEPVEPSRNGSSRSVTRQGRKGRRETKTEILKALKELWLDPVFQALENRTEQARALRARVLGEAARGADNRQGYMTSSLIRLIGEYATAQENEKN
jgi:hypothetical protein